MRVVTNTVVELLGHVPSSGAQCEVDSRFSVRFGSVSAYPIDRQPDTRYTSGNDRPKGVGEFIWDGPGGFMTPIPLCQVKMIEETVLPAVASRKLTYLRFYWSRTDEPERPSAADFSLSSGTPDGNGNYSLVLVFDYRGKPFIDAVVVTICELSNLLGVPTTHFSRPKTARKTWVAPAGEKTLRDIAAVRAKDLGIELGL